MIFEWKEIILALTLAFHLTVTVFGAENSNNVDNLGFTTVHSDDVLLGASGSNLEEVLSLFAVQHNEDKNRDLNITGQWTNIRNLDESDYKELNEILSANIMNLDDFDSDTQIGFLTAGIAVSDIVCGSLEIDDMSIFSKKKSDQKISIQAALPVFHFECTMAFQWNLGGISDGGRIHVRSEDSSISTGMSFLSKDYSTFAPHNATVEDCNTNIQLSELEFTGSVTSMVLNWMNDLIKSALQGQLNLKVCNEIGPVTTEYASAFVFGVKEKIEQFSNTTPAEEWRNDPLYAESLLMRQQQESPDLDGGQLVDFQNPRTEAEKLITTGIDLVGGYFGIDILSIMSATQSSSIDQGKMNISSSETNPDSNNNDNALDNDIGVIMMAAILDDDGVFNIKSSDFADSDPDFFEADIDLFHFKASFDGIKITGLDKYTEFIPAMPIGNLTYETRGSWKNIQLEIDLVLHLSPSKALKEDTDLAVNYNGGDITEHFQIRVGFDDVSASLTTLLAITRDSLSKLGVGTMLYMDNLLPCGLSLFHESVGVTGLDVSIGNIQEPVIDGFISLGLDKTISEIIEAIFLMYEDILLNALPSIFQGVIRDTMNLYIQQYISGSECPAPPSNFGKGETIDFRDLFLSGQDALRYGGTGNSPYGDVFPWIYTVMQENFLQIDEETGAVPLIDLFSVWPMAEDQSVERGVIHFPDKIFHENFGVVAPGTDEKLLVGLTLQNIKIENSDTVGEPLSLIDPVVDEPNELRNIATIGVGNNPFRISTNVVFTFQKGESTSVYNDFNIILEAYDAKMTLNILMKIMTERMINFPLNDISNPYCWLATIPAPALDDLGYRLEGSDHSAAITQLEASMRKLQVKIECKECSSIGIQEWAEELDNPENVEGASSAGNDALELLSTFIGSNFSQIQIDRLLNEAASNCPHHASTVNEKGDDTNQSMFQKFTNAVEAANYTPIRSVIVFVSSIAFAIALIVGIAIAIRIMVKKRYENWRTSLSQEQLNALSKKQRLDDDKERDLNAITKSMFTSNTAIPTYARYGIPVVLLGNIALFLSGHLNRGAAFDIQGHIAGQEFALDDFFVFTIASTTVDLFKAGAVELALLIVVFSGIWPYTRILFSFVMWFVPPKSVSVSRRGSILSWLDSLAKWSMVDIFAFVVSLVGFRMSITSPTMGFLPEDIYNVELFIQPLWGLYANMIAQLIAQISSHFIIHYHRRVVNEAEAILLTEKNESSIDIALVPTASMEDSISLSPKSEICNDEDNEERTYQLCNYEYTRLHRDDPNDKLTVRSSTNYLVFGTAGLLCVLLILGCSLPTFSVEVLGLLGLMIEAGQDFNPSITMFSVFTIPVFIMSQAQIMQSNAQTIGLLIFSFLFVFCVFIAPLLQTIALVYLWYRPMTDKTRLKVLVYIEILSAWQYCEVFVISVVFAAWQLGPTSQMMINVYCSKYNESLMLLGYYGLLDPKDIQCFQVLADIEISAYLITIAAFLLALLNAFVLKASRQYSLNKESSTNANAITRDSEKQYLEENAEAGSKGTIPPPLVQFSDSFRWSLVNVRKSRFGEI